MNDDFLDLLAAFLESDVEFIVVGAHALAVHGVPRATGDLDVWVRPTPRNAERVMTALGKFGAPVETLAIGVDDFSVPEAVVQIGLPPRRIDVLTTITNVEFDDAWNHRVTKVVGVGSGQLTVPFLGREELLRNKRATGRTKDAADVERLTNDDD